MLPLKNTCNEKKEKTAIRWKQNIPKKNNKNK